MFMFDKTAKNNIRLQVKDVAYTGSTQTGQLTVSVPGYQDRELLFSTTDVAIQIANLMLADFNGKS